MRTSILFVAQLAAAGIASAQARPTDRPVWPDEGPRTWTPRPTTSAITANDLRSRLYPLAHDSMRGRRAGEPGNYTATEYIAREFRRLGLVPAGDSGTFFQTLPFGPIGFDSAASRLAVAGSPLEHKSQWIPLAGGDADFADVPTVFAGRYGDTVSLDPAVFTGKVAVLLGSPVVAQRPAPLLSCDAVPDRFGARAAIRTDSAATAARGARPAPAPRDARAQQAGAVAVLYVALDSLSRILVTNAFTARMTMRPAAARGMATAAISHAAATALFERAPDQLTIGVAGRPVSARWRYEWRISSAPARNVIAVLPGSDPARANEYVLVGAHNDHVGVSGTAVDHDSLRAVNIVTRRQGANDPGCRPTIEQQRRIDSMIARARSIRPPRRDSIMNGADDDGSGTVVLLEIAERFAAEKPARSIVFISHQGEEAGLLGSRWFTDNPTVPLASIVAAHNMDMVGKGRADQVKFGGPASVQILGARRLSTQFGDMIDSVNAVRAEVMAIDKTWDVTANPMNRFCRSDQVNYVRRSIPVTYFSTGYAPDYHQATDEPQYIDYEHSARLGRFVHDVMAAIANRRDRLVIDGPDPAYPSCGR
jgi:hypothetical protein